MIRVVMKTIPTPAVVLLSCWISAAGCFSSAGQDSAKTIDQALEQLRDLKAEVRISGLRNLQTSLDPRIPEACLPLLADEGNSIRRLAARAIGSRYHQIKSDRVPAFVSALKRNLAKEESADQAVGRMAERAIGLLTRKYGGEMFAASLDGKWVIYERHRLPCLIDIESDSEGLLGWKADFNPSFSPAWGNGPVAEAAIWHKESRAVGLEIIENRKLSIVWIWIAKGSQLVRLEVDGICKALLIDPETVFGPGGFFVSIDRWEKDEFVFEVFLTVSKDPDQNKFEDVEATVAWDLNSGKLRKLK